MERRIQDLDYRFSKNKFKIAAYVRVVARVRGHLSWAESCIPHAQNAYRFGPLFNTRITGYGTSYTLAHVLQSCLTVCRIYVCETRRRDVFMSLLDLYWSFHITASLVQADCIKDWAHVGFGGNFCIPTNAAWEGACSIPQLFHSPTNLATPLPAAPETILNSPHCAVSARQAPSGSSIFWRNYQLIYSCHDAS